MERNYKIDPKLTGERIKKLAKANNLKVREIQEACDLTSVQTVYHWFCGQSVPSIDSLVALSELLEVRIDDLLVRTK